MGTTRLQCVEYISVDFATMELHHYFPACSLVSVPSAETSHVSRVTVRQSHALHWVPDRKGRSFRVFTTDYILCMAAITSQFPSEMTKHRRKKSKTLLNVLTAACAYSLWRSYMNNTHMRTQISKGTSALLLVGTTSNEAVPVELRAAFPQVYDMHVPFMRPHSDLLCALQACRS